MNALQSASLRFARRLAPWKLRVAMHSGPPRDRAFARYHHTLLGLFNNPAPIWTVTSVQAVTPSDKSSGTFQIRLARPPSPDIFPGDLLHVAWENPAPLAARVAELCHAPSNFTFWTRGSILCPPRRLRTSSTDFLRKHIDLSFPSSSLLQLAQTDPSPLPEFLQSHPHLASLPTLLAHQPAPNPRLYTISRILPDSIEILVRRGPRTLGNLTTTGRAGGFLTSLAPGRSISARVLPHPHRLPTEHGFSGPGLVIVTGSAVAGLLSHLRLGKSFPNTCLLWGVRDQQHAAFARSDLERAVTEQRLGALLLAESRSSSPTRVQDLIPSPALTQSLSLPSSWIYVSGHEAMADAVRQKLLALPIPDLANWPSQLRWIESASA